MKSISMNKRVLRIAAAFVLMLAGLQVSATHLRAGNITVQRLDCAGLTFAITVTVYTNAQSQVIFSDSGLGILDFGDNSKPDNPRPDAGMPVPNYDGTQFHYVAYTINHTYAGGGRYVISYSENNRNDGILNINHGNSVNVPFYIDTVIDIDPLEGCDNSPVLKTPPIDKACSGTRWVHNPGAYDIDDDSLSYELVVPKQAVGSNVPIYEQPNSADLYTGINYNQANQAKNGPPTFTIDPIHGTVTWDAPGAAGQYNIAFHVIEWRKINGVARAIGYVTRDMQIIVESCSNHPPQLIGPRDTCVVAGALVQSSVVATDADNDPVRIEGFSQVFTINPSHATLTPPGTAFAASPATAKFVWQTECLHVKEQPYQVVFKATDNPPSPQTALVDFITWNITVVGPPPAWTSVQPLPGRRAKLVWQPYTCKDLAVSMQIWRRVESNPYDPPNCVTGMPPFLGFTMIGVVPIGTTQYTDTNQGRGLAPGAQYCYRLVAVFPQPTGGLSLVSKEECFLSLQNEPVITNVSIDVTNNPLSPVIGEDTIRWLAPKKSDTDTIAFPPPYSYTVYRAEDLNGNTNLTAVSPGKQSATFFVDSDIDTNGKTYNYRIVAFASNGQPLDTAATATSASTVRLSLRPHDASIDLSWNADVPWSNILAAHPLHTVFRGPDNSTRLSDLQKIATVDVTAQGLRFTDSGPLDKTKTYCYCVATSGGYGNPLIPEPLINFSQITCIQPSDSTKPCTVMIKATGTNCSDYKGANTCDVTSFSNTLTWLSPTAACQPEVASYNIYSASLTTGSYTLLATGVVDTFYVDSHLASYAQCYKVSAVSRSGIESDVSAPFCFDNCPHYELPNVFTPGLVDQCNDVFSAYSARPFNIPEGGSAPPCKLPDDIDAHCAKFVNSVNFTVFNRWGKQVYSYQSGGENSIFIDWDGRDDQGKELSAGVYYYLADVNFNVVNPAEQNQKVKGWVQIVR